jgi:hypothetical protein
MTSDQPILLQLEVDRDADPITGTLSEDGKNWHPFTGWLGLTDAIEEIRASRVPTPASPTRDGDA